MKYYYKSNWFKIFCKTAWDDLETILIILIGIIGISAVILGLIHYPIFTLIATFLIFGLGRWIKKTNEIAADNKRDAYHHDLEVIEQVYRAPAIKIYDTYMRSLEPLSELDIEKYKTYKEEYYKEVKSVLEFYKLTEDDVYIRPVYELVIDGKVI